MTCKYCGRPLAEDAKYCDACGKPVVEEKPKEEKKKPRHSRRRLLHFLRGMILGLLLANAIVAISNSDLGKLAISAHKAKKAVQKKLEGLKHG